MAKLISDVCCGWPKRHAITAAHKVTERCRLGADARQALQNFECTTRGEERGQIQPIRSQY